MLPTRYAVVACCCLLLFSNQVDCEFVEILSFMMMCSQQGDLEDENSYSPLDRSRVSKGVQQEFHIRMYPFGGRRTYRDRKVVTEIYNNKSYLSFLLFAKQIRTELGECVIRYNSNEQPYVSGLGSRVSGLGSPVSGLGG